MEEIEGINWESEICEMDVKEWIMELRENNIVMNEMNVKDKEQKMKVTKGDEARLIQARQEDLEGRQNENEKEMKKLKEQRVKFEERMKLQRENYEREEVVDTGHKEILGQKQPATEKQFEYQEKNAILEIRLNRREKEMGALQIRNLQEREHEMYLQHQNLDRRELELGEKSSILDVAIRLNRIR
jgi:hypothetical protein